MFSIAIHRQIPSNILDTEKLTSESHRVWLCYSDSLEIRNVIFKPEFIDNSKLKLAEQLMQVLADDLARGEQSEPYWRTMYLLNSAQFSQPYPKYGALGEH